MKLRMMALVVLAGCGGSGGSGTTKAVGKTVQFTCDVQTETANTCTEIVIAPEQSADAQNACLESGGMVTFDSCTRDGYLGVCRGIDQDGVMATFYEFPSPPYTTALGAQTSCTNLGGTFTAAPVVPTYCGYSTLCYEFPALGTPQEKMDAQATCTADEYGTLKTGSCSVSPLAGICKRSLSDGAEWDEYWVKDLATNVSDLDEEGVQTGGTWTNG